MTKMELIAILEDPEISVCEINVQDLSNTYRTFEGQLVQHRQGTSTIEIVIQKARKPIVPIVMDGVKIARSNFRPD